MRKLVGTPLDEFFEELPISCTHCGIRAEPSDLVLDEKFEFKCRNKQACDRRFKTDGGKAEREYEYEGEEEWEEL
jgi:hypothetical protein